MPCQSSEHLTEILNELYHAPDYCQRVAEDCYTRVTDPQFGWDTVASQFGGIFEDVMSQVDHSVPVETKKTPRNQKKKRSLQKETADAVA
jgi:hypothetical protein